MRTAAIRLPAQGVYSVEWLAAHPDETQRMLRSAHGRHALCLCRRPHPKLYIARRSGTYYLARFPESGASHAPQCASYTPDPAQCGRGAYAPGALTERPDGRVSVNLDAPLDVVPHDCPSSPSPRRASLFGTAREGLSLTGLLHLLWDRAGFSRWSPAMLGRRHYRQVHRFLLEAAADVLVKRRPLAERLWMPEPFVPANRVEIDARRSEALARLSRRAGHRQSRVLVAAQLKSITPADSGGCVLRLAHTPPHLVLACGPAATDRLRRSAGPSGLQWPAIRESLHVFVLLTMRRTDVAWTVSRLAALTTSCHYLPVTTEPDLVLTEHLVQTRRHFYKPLAYDARADHYPRVLLTDAGKDPVPLEISEGEGARGVIGRRVQAWRDRGGLCWHWDRSVTPTLPCRSIPRPPRWRRTRAGASLGD